MDHKHGRDQTCCHVEFSETPKVTGMQGGPAQRSPEAAQPSAAQRRPPKGGQGCLGHGINCWFKGQGILRRQPLTGHRGNGGHFKAKPKGTLPCPAEQTPQERGWGGEDGRGKSATLGPT